MTRGNISTLEAQWSRLLARAAAGEEILIVRGRAEKPVGRLVAARPRRKPPRAAARGARGGARGNDARGPATDLQAEGGP